MRTPNIWECEAPAEPLGGKLLIQNGSAGVKGAELKLEELADGMDVSLLRLPGGSAYFEYLGVDARPGPLVPKTRTRFDSQSLERPFAELSDAERAA